MSRLQRFSWFAAVAMSTAIGLVQGCADERPPRSYVQPNVIKKTDLTGTFYYLQTVTDAPPTNGSAFIGLSSELQKIRFDVSEDYLYARRAYEQVEGSEEIADPANYKGSPLAAWRISKQFDIIRQFNSTTGEQTNQIVEDEERPWEQREFVRVDWSQNLVTDYVGIGLNFWFEDVQVEPSSQWVSDPTKPDGLHMERNANATQPDGFAQGEMTYLDITDQLVVTPDNLTATFEEGGQTHSFSFPKCFFPGEQNDCASQVVKVRHAFAKIGPKHDYEPRLWDGTQMNLFGVWDVGLRRLTYNRDYGVTNAGFDRHAARFNIWQRSYQDDGKTLIPAEQRTLRTIPYYAEGSRVTVFNGHPVMPDGMVDNVYPEDLFDAKALDGTSVGFKEIVRQWNDAMQVAAFDVITKGNLNGTGGTYDPNGAALPVMKASDLPPVFIACHNPVHLVDVADSDGKIVWAKDPAGCVADLAPDLDVNGNPVLDKMGNPIYHARQGDPRRSNVFWVDQQQNAGPLGYGPPLFDPTSGETISGQAYIYGAAVDSYSVRSRDLLMLQNGEISPEDFTQGVNVQDWVNAHRFGGGLGGNGSQQLAGPSSALALATKKYERHEVLALSKAMDFSWAKAFAPSNGYPPLDTTSLQGLQASMSNRMKKIGDNYFTRLGVDRDSKLQRIIGTPLEKMMMNTEMLAISGVSPAKSWDDLSEPEKMLASPLRQKVMSDWSEGERIKAETIGVDFETFSDPGIAQDLQGYLDLFQGDALSAHADQLRDDLRQRIFLGVTLHEVGHNMGCRHNFRASYDAMNYFPQYWKLRTAGMQNPDSGMAKSDGKLHPRYVNVAGGAVTTYEAQNRIREYQYSSIMDYGAEFNSDLQGLGLYDKALIKFSYANYVEVFTDMKTDTATLNKMAAMSTFQTALGFPSPLGLGAGLTAIPYHSYPTLFNSGADGIYQRKDVPYSMIQPTDSGSGNTYLGYSDDASPLVPYYFCSDEFAGNMTCQRFDSGADAYEQAADLVSRYQNFYVYNAFKRDRYSFWSSLGYMSRIKGRYFTMLQQQLQWYVLLRADFEDFLATDAALGAGNDPNKVIDDENAFFVNEDGWGNFTLAVSMGFDLIGQTLATPSAGWHFKTTKSDGTSVFSHFNDTTTPINDPRVLTVGLLDGKYIDTTWDFTNCGYYWAEECQTRVGYFVDKTIALDVLTTSQAYFTGRDTSVDVRKYAIGYYLPFKKQIAQNLGAILAGDDAGLAAYPQTSKGKTTVLYPSWTLTNPTIDKGTPIDPQTGFTIALYAGIYGLSTFPTTFDHDFVDTTKIFVVGNGEASTSDATIQAQGTDDPTKLVSHGGTSQWFLVTDPTSGKQFVAHSTPTQALEVLDARSTDPTHMTSTVALRDDIGVRMLERLQILATVYSAAVALPDGTAGKDTKVAAAQLDLQNFRENIEVMRSLQNAFGYGPYKTDAPFYY